ncbi:teichuronic acid biosynthesis protein TuaH [Bacillus gobiensis]|uniref:teichuronic acid biosynthesis protein TuaH n=1 Tax=Bacillus gobiensis TaxID=1441095 RepID=UPI003D23F752
MTDNKEIHVIVATGEWNNDALKYRRHRLAEFLAEKDNTAEVIWVCPTSSPHSNKFHSYSDKIKQYFVADISSNRMLRFARYFDIFYKNKLDELIRYVNNQDAKKYLWHTFPGFPLLQRIISWDRVTYDCSDLWAIQMGGKKNLINQFRQKSISSAENRIIAGADNIFCTSDFLYEKVKGNQSLNGKTQVTALENGVEFEAFSKGEERSEEASPGKASGPVLGFIGGIKPKLDFELLNRVMSEKEDWKLLLVGPDATNNSPSFQQLLTNKNVNWVGEVPPAEVPEYMDKLDIGILPYKSSEYNKAVFPLKLFEFLAAGKPVVGMNLPSTKKYSQPMIYEYIDDSDEQFVKACETLFKDSLPFTKERVELAQKHDWQEIFKTMYGKAVESK